MLDSELEKVAQTTAFKQMKKDATFGEKTSKFYRKGNFSIETKSCPRLK